MVGVIICELKGGREGVPFRKKWHTAEPQEWLRLGKGVLWKYFGSENKSIFLLKRKCYVSYKKGKPELIFNYRANQPPLGQVTECCWGRAPRT